MTARKLVMGKWENPAGWEVDLLAVPKNGVEKGEGCHAQAVCQKQGVGGYQICVVLDLTVSRNWIWFRKKCMAFTNLLMRIQKGKFYRESTEELFTASRRSCPRGQWGSSRAWAKTTPSCAPDDLQMNSIPRFSLVRDLLFCGARESVEMSLGVRGRMVHGRRSFPSVFHCR
jgi:hypothetical protein